MDSMISFGHIQGVQVRALKEIFDPKGSVLHFFRNDHEDYHKFGECYFSEIQYNAIKAWKYHTKQTQNMTIPLGSVQFVLYDDRNSSPTYKKVESFTIGRPNQFFRLSIPPGVIYGFKGLVKDISLIANLVDIPHDPDESKKIDIGSGYVPYQWDTDQS